MVPFTGCRTPPPPLLYYIAAPPPPRVGTSFGAAYPKCVALAPAARWLVLTHSHHRSRSLTLPNSVSVSHLIISSVYIPPRPCSPSLSAETVAAMPPVTARDLPRCDRKLHPPTRAAGPETRSSDVPFGRGDPSDGGRRDACLRE